MIASVYYLTRVIKEIFKLLTGQNTAAPRNEDMKKLEEYSHPKQSSHSATATTGSVENLPTKASAILPTKLP